VGSSVRLIVEVVSTNWRDGYRYKLVDYEALSIPEYWVTDYLRLLAPDAILAIINNLLFLFPS